MTPPVPVAASAKRDLLGARLMAVLAAIAMCIAALYCLRWAEGIGDDYYFYRLGLAAEQRAVGADIHLDLLARADSLAIPRYDRQDLKVKSKAAVNYPLLAFSVGVAHATTEPLRGAACRDEFSTLVLPTLIRGWTLQFLTCLAVTLLVLLLWGESQHLRGFALLVLVLAALEFALVPPRYDWRLAESATLPQLLGALGQFFLNPAVNLSPFGHTGRNAYLLLLPAFAMLRWSRLSRFSYCILPVMMGVHQINTLMTMLLLIPFDLFVRPQIFRQWPTLGSIAIVCLLFLSGNPLSYSVDASSTGLLLPVGVTLVALALTVGSAALSARIFRRGEFVASPTPIGPEIGYITAVICVTAVATWGIVQVVGIDAAKFTWSELSGRLVSVARVLILFGLAILAVRRLDTLRATAPRHVLTAGTAVGLLGLIAVTALRIQRDPIDPMNQFRDEDRRFRSLTSATFREPVNQDIVLYLAARGAECGRESVAVPLRNLRPAQP
ncbi:MAG: hypothetical protein V4813_11130 [Gemmatimonadota bacterium]